MPGCSYSIPAKHCKRGSILRKIPGSACSKCYALKGRYVFANVQNAQQNRFDKMVDPRWVEAMTTLIDLRTKKETPYFRWFDSGDIQNVDHFKNICQIAQNLPHIKFWLPTRELDIIRKHEHLAPKNLTIRISASMLGEVIKGFNQTSSIALKGAKPNWKKLVGMSTNAYHRCPAPLQEGECKKCRACWMKSIKNIVYLEH